MKRSKKREGSSQILSFSDVHIFVTLLRAVRLELRIIGDIRVPEYIERESLLAYIKDLPTWWEDGGGVYGPPMKYPEGNFDPEDVEVVFKRSSAFPFDPGCSPVTLRVKASKVQGWSLKEDRFTPALPSDVQIIDGSDTTLELVPYGSTTLRLTIFPVAP